MSSCCGYKVRRTWLKMVRIERTRHHSAIVLNYIISMIILELIFKIKKLQAAPPSAGSVDIYIRITSGSPKISNHIRSLILYLIWKLDLFSFVGADSNPLTNTRNETEKLEWIKCATFPREKVGENFLWSTTSKSRDKCFIFFYLRLFIWIGTLACNGPSFINYRRLIRQQSPVIFRRCQFLHLVVKWIGWRNNTTVEHFN